MMSDKSSLVDYESSEDEDLSGARENAPRRTDPGENAPRRIDAGENAPRRIDAGENAPNRVVKTLNAQNRIDAMSVVTDKVMSKRHPSKPHIESYRGAVLGAHAVTTKRKEPEETEPTEESDPEARSNPKDPVAETSDERDPGTLSDPMDPADEIPNWYRDILGNPESWTKEKWQGCFKIQSQATLGLPDARLG